MKYVLWGVVLVVVIIGVCSAVHLWRVAARNAREMKTYEGAPAALEYKLGKTLVVYYSLTGHTKDIALQIAQLTGADMWEVQTEPAFKPGIKLYWTSYRQLKTGNYPSLKEPVPDLAAYDTVFVGSPVWCYSVSSPVLALLRDTDWQGKTVVPFFTQGSNTGSSVEDFAAHAKNAHILPAATFNNLDEKYDAAVKNKIIVWLNSLERK